MVRLGRLSRDLVCLGLAGYGGHRSGAAWSGPLRLGEVGPGLAGFGWLRSGQARQDRVWSALAWSGAAWKGAAGLGMKGGTIFPRRGLVWSGKAAARLAEAGWGKSRCGKVRRGWVRPVQVRRGVVSLEAVWLA